MKKISLLVTLVLAMLLASCDPSLSFSDGTVTVSVSNINMIPGFSAGTSDIYFYAYENYNTSTGFATDFVAGTWIDSYNGSSTSVTIGVNPPYVFTGGETYYVDVLVDLNGDNDLSTGTVYWLRAYQTVSVDGDMIVTVDNSDFVDAN